MATFTDREKDVIRKIAESNPEAPHTFGRELCDVLINTNEFAFLLSTFFNNQEYITECKLLAYNNGGISNNRARAAIVELISLIQYLEENRFVLIVDGPQLPEFCLYFNGDSTSYYRDTLPNYRIRDEEDSNSYEFPLQDNAHLSIIECLSGGIRNRISASINLSDGNSLSEAGYGDNLTNPLIRLLNSFVYPTLKLKKFVENDFKTDEEKFNEKTLDKVDEQIRQAKNQVERGTQAVRLAILTLLLTVLTTLFQSFQDWVKLLLGFCILSIVLVCGYMLRDGVN